MPASVTHEHGRPAGRAASTSSPARDLLVVLVVADDPAAELDPERGREPAQPAGVLGGDDVRLGEQPDEPGRRVPGIADRRRRQHQDPRRRVVRHATTCRSRGSPGSPAGLMAR